MNEDFYVSWDKMNPIKEPIELTKEQHIRYFGRESIEIADEIKVLWGSCSVPKTEIVIEKEKAKNGTKVKTDKTPSKKR